MNVAEFIEKSDKLYKEHAEYCKLNGSDDSFSSWLIEKYMDAEATLEKISAIASTNTGARLTEMRRVLREYRSAK